MMQQKSILVEPDLTGTPYEGMVRRTRIIVKQDTKYSTHYTSKGHEKIFVDFKNGCILGKPGNGVFKHSKLTAVISEGGDLEDLIKGFMKKFGYPKYKSCLEGMSED